MADLTLNLIFMQLTSVLTSVLTSLCVFDLNVDFIVCTHGRSYPQSHFYAVDLSVDLNINVSLTSALALRCVVHYGW